MPGKKKGEKPTPVPTGLHHVILMLEAIRLEIRAASETTPGFPARPALRSESDAISARVLRNA